MQIFRKKKHKKQKNRSVGAIFHRNKGYRRCSQIAIKQRVFPAYPKRTNGFCNALIFSSLYITQIAQRKLRFTIWVQRYCFFLTYARKKRKIAHIGAIFRCLMLFDASRLRWFDVVNDFKPFQTISNNLKPLAVC